MKTADGPLRALPRGAGAVAPFGAGVAPCPSAAAGPPLRAGVATAGWSTKSGPGAPRRGGDVRHWLSLCNLARGIGVCRDLRSWHRWASSLSSLLRPWPVATHRVMARTAAAPAGPPPAVEARAAAGAARGRAALAAARGGAAPAAVPARPVPAVRARMVPAVPARPVPAVRARVAVAAVWAGVAVRERAAVAAAGARAARGARAPAVVVAALAPAGVAARARTAVAAARARTAVTGAGGDAGGGGTTGAGGATGAGGSTPCGVETCTSDELCLKRPLCPDAPICGAVPDSGLCPRGTSYGPCGAPLGIMQGCVADCPSCVARPASCGATPTCSCIPVQLCSCNSVSGQVINCN
jgi:hypothetical protein